MKHQMNTIAISQVIDQVLRVIVIFIAISVFMYMDVSIYQAGTIAISGSVIGLFSIVLYFYLKRKPNIHFSWEINFNDLKDVIIMTVLYAISYLILILCNSGFIYINPFTTRYWLYISGKHKERYI